MANGWIVSKTGRVLLNYQSGVVIELVDKEVHAYHLSADADAFITLGEFDTESEATDYYLRIVKDVGALPTWEIQAGRATG